MRLALRWLTFIILIAILLVYFHQESGFGLAIVKTNLPWQSPTGPTGQASPAAELNPTQPVKTIAELWQKWGNAIYEARPIKIAPIKILGSANTHRPSNPDQPRKPARDRVRNPDEDIQSLRRSHQLFVKELRSLETNGDSDIFQGRGLVMVGGGEYFGPAIIGIHMLRRTGCVLPVEVFVPDESEYEAEICDVYLPKLNAKCVVLDHLTQGGPKDLQIKHYQLKAPALLLSSFAEVLLLDSDSIPLLDPNTTIFNTEPYLSSGLITWPDYWGATESPKFWEIAGFTSFPKDLPAMSRESGQLVINKKTHLGPLLLATYYNLFGPKYYYSLLSQGALGEGDKETFLAAAVALKTPYYNVKTDASTVGRFDGAEDKSTAIVQHLPSDDMAQGEGESQKTIRPAFLHSNTPKMNAGHLVDEGDLISTDGKSRLRLLGSKPKAEALFGFDIEDAIWDLLVQTGCELAGSIREWKDRERLCGRLTEHHKLVFDETP